MDRSTFTSLVLVVVLLANQLLSITKLVVFPETNRAPHYHADAGFPQGEPDMQADTVPELINGRLLFAPAVDGDGDPATNPTSVTPVPLIRVSDMTAGAFILAAQLMPDEGNRPVNGIPAVFRVWNAQGVVAEQTMESDAWGAIQAEMRLLNPVGEYFYQVSAEGYGESERRTFQFDATRTMMTIHAHGAELSATELADGRLDVTLRSPLPLTAGRDEPALIISRRPMANSTADSPFQPILESVHDAGLRLPFPRVSMEIVGTHTARLTIRLPQGDYRLMGSLSVNGTSIHHYFTAPVEMAVSTSAVVPPGSTPAWVANLEHEAGQTLVQYDTRAGEATFDLVSSVKRPTLAPPVEPNGSVTVSWRTGPFTWQAQKYAVALDEANHLALIGFRYDPILRRYGLELHSVAPVAVQEQVQVEVLGPHGSLLHREETTLTFDPAMPTTYAVQLSASLGKPHGVRITALRPNTTRGNPVLLSAMLESEETISGALASGSSLSGTDGEFPLLAALRNMAAQMMRGDALKEKLQADPGFQYTMVVVAKAFLNILEVEVATVEYTYMPGVWGGGFPPWFQIAEQIFEGFFYNWWMDAKLVLVSGGVNVSADIALQYTISAPNCPDEQWRESVETRLKLMADNIDLRFQELLGEDDGGFQIYTPRVPVFTILMIWAEGTARVRPTADSEGLSVRFGFRAELEVSLAVGVDVTVPGWDVIKMAKNVKKYFGSFVLAVETVAFLGSLSAWRNSGPCPPPDQINPNPPDGRPPDDRQDVWQQVVNNLTEGNSYEETLGTLTMLRLRAQERGLMRAETVITRHLRETEMARFVSQTAPLYNYLDAVDAISYENRETLVGIISGTIPISPTMTLTEALIYQNEQAAALIDAEPYPAEMRLLTDNLNLAQQAYLALYGQELQVEHELRDLFFNGTVGVVASGFPYATMQALDAAGVPGQIISLTPGQQGYRRGQSFFTAPYVAPELAPRALIMPSGGLHRVSHSPEARAWLDAYVRGGGILLVFTQAFGNDWAALPGGDVRGIGYEEDQRCQQESVRAAMPSRWLAWMGMSTPDIQVDGAFTGWPADANILLLRRSGLYEGYPAMIEYPLGAGRVIATSAYGDWVTQTAMWWGDDWQMTRTLLIRLLLLAQGQDLDDVLTTTPDTDVTVPFSVTNSSVFTATNVRLELPIAGSRLPGYNGNIANIPLALPGGTSSTVSTLLHTPPVMRGIHNWTQVGLFNLKAKVNATQQELFRYTPGYIHVQSPLTPPAVGLTLHANPVTAFPYEAVTVTATIRNFSSTLRTIRLSGVRDLPTDPITVTVAAGGMVTHTYGLVMDRSYFPKAVLYNQSGNPINNATLAVYIGAPNLETEATFPTTVETGSPLTITVSNLPGWWRPASDVPEGQLYLTLTSPVGNVLWQSDSPLPPIAVGQTVTLPFTMGVLPPGTLGNYTLQYAIDALGERQTEGEWYVRSSVNSEGVFNAPTYRIGDTLILSATLQNNGPFTVAPTVTLEIPGIDRLTTHFVTMAGRQTATVVMSATIPLTATAGTYSVRLAAEADEIHRNAFAFVIPPARIEGSTTVSPTVQAGETLYVTLHNIGGVDTVATAALKLGDGRGVVIAQTNITTTLYAGVPYSMALPIPTAAASGNYWLVLEGNDTESAQSFGLQRQLTVQGISAGLAVATDEFAYGPGESITAEGEVTALSGTVSGTLEMAIVPATLGDFEVGTETRVNPNNEWGHIQHHDAELAFDGAGNGYVVWADDRAALGDVNVYFAFRPAGGEWGASVLVNDLTVGDQWQPDIVVDGTGNAWVVWLDQPDVQTNGAIRMAQRPAGGTWGTSERVDVSASGTTSNHPALAVGADGTAYVAWRNVLNSGDIHFAYRPAGGSWSAIEQVSDDTTNHVQQLPELVVDSTDTVHVVWQDQRATHYDIYYASRPAAGGWSPNVKVNSDTGTNNQTNPTISIDGTDTLYALWGVGSGTTGIFLSTQAPAGTWSVSQRVTTGGDSLPQFELASDGSGHLLFQRSNDIYHATRSAAGTWSGVTRINESTGVVQGDPAMAVSPEGDVIAAWEDHRGPGGVFQHLWGDVRPAGTGLWGTDIRVSDASGGANQSRPHVTIGNDGTLYAVWADTQIWNGSGGVDVFYSTRPVSGTWSIPERANGTWLASGSNNPVIGVDGSGNVTLLWQERFDRIVFSTRPATGSWSAPAYLALDTLATQSSPDLKVDPGGNAYAVWANVRNGFHNIYFSYRPAGGTWSAATAVNDISSTTERSQPAIELDDGGNAYVTWYDSRNGQRDIYFAYRPAGGSWSTNVRVNDDPLNNVAHNSPDIDVDDAGNAYLVWRDARVTVYDFFFAKRPVGGTWSTNEKLPPVCITGTPRIAAHENGSVTVAWSGCGVHITQRTPGGYWHPPVRVDNGATTNTNNQEMVLDGNGNALLFWDVMLGDRTDIHHTPVALPMGNEYLWDESLPIHTSTSQNVNAPVGTLEEVPGKYYLEGTLVSPLSQTLATHQVPFYLFPEGIELTIQTDEALYRPGETITVTGYLTNSNAASTTLTLTLTANGTPLLEQPYLLAAGEGVSYSAVTSSTTDLLFEATAGAAEMAHPVAITEPDGDADLMVPPVVGSTPFSATIAITNTGLITLELEVALGNSATTPLSVAPGTVELIAQTLVVTQTSILTAAIEGDLSETFNGLLQWGEGGTVQWEACDLPPELIPCVGGTENAGTVPLSYMVTGTGSLPTRATLYYQAGDAPVVSGTLTLIPGEQLTNTILVPLEAGSHTMQVWLEDSNGQLLDSDTGTITIHPDDPFALPQIEIVDVTVAAPRETNFTAPPQAFTTNLVVTVLVSNNGPSAPVVAGIQIADTPYQWVITAPAYGEASFDFTVPLPDDLPAGDYLGTAVVGNANISFVVPLTQGQAASDVALSVALDNSAYLPGDMATLTVTLEEQAGITGDYPLALRYGDYEDTLTVTLGANSTITHTFTFTATESQRASITLAQLQSAGQRVIMIDSLPVKVVDQAADATLRFDKTLYSAGETINLTVDVPGTVNSILLVGPLEYQLTDEPFLFWFAPMLSDTLNVVTGTHTVSYTLPAELRTGQYTFDLRINGTSHLYTVDVRGWSVLTRRITLNQATYRSGDTISAQVEFINEGTSMITGLALKAYLFLPDGRGMEVPLNGSSGVSLAPGWNLISVEGILDTDMAGPHTFLINITAQDKLWRVAGASAQIDVGSAHLVELTADKGNYAPGESGTGRLDVYGHGATHLSVIASTGAILLEDTVTLSGFETFTFTLPTASTGDYLLTAMSTDVGGVTDTLTLAYAVPVPPDTEAPTVALTSPTTTTLLTSVAPTLTLTVTGNVSDNRALQYVLVNGQVVTPTLTGVTGTFTATLTLRQGLNGISATAVDMYGNIGYSPLVNVYLLPARTATLSVSQNPAQVGQTIFFEAVLSSTTVMSDVLWHLPLPSAMVTDVVVMATGGTTTLNGIDPAIADATWVGDVGTTPTTITVEALLTHSGTLTATATTIWGWGVREDDTQIVAVFVPTSVMLADFTATPDAQAIRVLWETASETDNLGFNLWRGMEHDAPTEQLNSELILSQAPGNGQGALYEWLDETVESGEIYYYWLEAVSITGATTQFGPVSAQLPPPTAVSLTDFDKRPPSGWYLTDLLRLLCLTAATVLLWQRMRKSRRSKGEGEYG